MTDLVDIRTRDAEFTIGGGEIPYLPGATRTQDWASAVNRAVIDRRALLAEVDRLTGVVEAWETALSLIPKAVADAETAERARLAEAVRGLDRDSTVVAVLAIIEGDER